MFCMKCGRPTEGEQILCPNCLAAQQPAQQETFTEAPRQAQPQLDLNLAGDAPAPKTPKKKKKGVVVLSVILALAILAGAVSYFFFDLGGVIEYSFVKLTKDEKDAAVFVEQKALEENSGMIGTVSNLLGSAAGGYGSMEDTFVDTSLSLETGEALTNILKQVIPASDSSLDVQQLLRLIENAKVSANLVTDEDLGQLDLKLQLNKEQLITLRAILDLATSEAYVGIAAPEGVSDSYMRLDLAEMGLDTDMITDSYARAFAMGEKMADMMPSQKELDTMLDKYVLLAVKNIDKVSEDTETIKADGVSQDVTVYEYTIDEATALKVVRAILKEAEHDDTLYDVVAAFCASYNYYMDSMYGDYYSSYYYKELHADELFEQIPYLLEELEDYEPENGGTKIILKTYVDAAGKICGRALEESESGTEVSMVTVTKGSKKSFDAKVTVSGIVAGKLAGTGTEKNGKLTGTYKLTSMGQTFLIVDLENFDMDTCLGTLRLQMGKALLEQVEDAVDSDVLALLGSLNIQLEITMEKNSFGFSLLLDGKKLIKLGCSAKEAKPGSVEVPDDSMAVADEFDLQDWMEQVDIAPIIDKLEKAGLPDELADALRELDPAGMMDDALNEDVYDGDFGMAAAAVSRY